MARTIALMFNRTLFSQYVVMIDIQKTYLRLDKLSKNLLRVLAFQHGGARYYQLTDQAQALGLRQGNGRALTQTLVREFMSKWTKQGLLRKDSEKIAPALLDLLVREGLAGEYSQQLLQFWQPLNRWVRRDVVLDFYVKSKTLIA